MVCFGFLLFHIRFALVLRFLVSLVTFPDTRFFTRFYSIMSLVFLVSFSDTRFLFCGKLYSLFIYFFIIFQIIFIFWKFLIFRWSRWKVENQKII